MRSSWRSGAEVGIRTRLLCIVLGHKDIQKRNDRHEVYWECRRCGHFSERSAVAGWGPGGMDNGVGGGM